MEEQKNAKIGTRVVLGNSKRLVWLSHVSQKRREELESERWERSVGPCR